VAKKNGGRIERGPVDYSLSGDGEWVGHLARLQDILTLCPTDVLTLCELASLQEALERHEEALFNWTAVLAADPNNLKAREGLDRCRRRTGRLPQSCL
jgi:predicted RNase H-like HicB family nuclease